MARYSHCNPLQRRVMFRSSAKIGSFVTAFRSPRLKQEATSPPSFLFSVFPLDSVIEHELSRSVYFLGSF
jgi:hypothetical protein